MHMASKSDDEPIKGILEESAKVRKAFGAFGGWLLIAWAVFAARRRGTRLRLMVTAVLALAGAGLAGQF